MIWLQIMVTVATLIAISSGLPQLVKLIHLKSSVEFNLGTWIMWTLAQVIFISYALLIGDALLVAVNGCWAMFYSLMVVLIIRYRPKRQLLATEPLPVAVQRKIHSMDDLIAIKGYTRSSYGKKTKINKKIGNEA